MEQITGQQNFLWLLFGVNIMFPDKPNADHSENEFRIVSDEYQNFLYKLGRTRWFVQAKTLETKERELSYYFN